MQTKTGPDRTKRGIAPRDAPRCQCGAKCAGMMIDENQRPGECNRCYETEKWERILTGLLLCGVSEVYENTRSVEPGHFNNPALARIVKALKPLRDAERDVTPSTVRDALDRAGVYGVGLMELPLNAFTMLADIAREAFLAYDPHQQVTRLKEFATEAEARVMVAWGERQDRWNHLMCFVLIHHRPIGEIKEALKSDRRWRSYADRFKPSYEDTLIKFFLEKGKEGGLW